MNDLLSPHARAVAERVLAEEGAVRPHLVVSLSGAHAYGFPSPDSDLDLKAIHVEPTSRLLGLAPPPPAPSRMEVVDGVDIDYSSNELAPALAGILKGNGNYIERVLGPILLVVSPELDELRPLVVGALSRRVHGHYRGFAGAILRELQAAAAPTAKSLLYVLRTALTGTHLLRTGTVVTDLGALAPIYGFPAARDLIAAKRAGERVTLSAETRDHWSTEIKRAFTLLDTSVDSSPLPPDPPNRPALESWLISLRRRGFMP